MNDNFKGQNIWIVGASSGIGRQLAIDLDAKGAKLILSARTKNSLLEINESLKQKHYVYPFDISSLTDITNAFNTMTDKKYNIDRVIIMAASYNPNVISNMTTETIDDIININFKGIVYFVSQLLNFLNEQKSAQIAICASIAGYIGLPNGQPYSATKAALINFTESLYFESPQNIDIKLINPGFVKTPLTTKNNFNMPMIVTVSKASEYIIKGLSQKKFEIHFPKKFTIIFKIIKLLPYKISFMLLKNIVNK